MIDLTRTSSEAVRDLKHYIEFAQKRVNALGEAITFAGGLDYYDYVLEESIANDLRKKG